MKGAASARASPFFPASPSLPAPGAPLPDKRGVTCSAPPGRPGLMPRTPRTRNATFPRQRARKGKSIAFLPQRSERRWKTAKHGRSGRSPLRTQTDVPYRRAKPGVFPAGQAFPRLHAQIRPAHGQQVVLKKIRLRPLRLRRVLVLCRVTSRSVLPSARSLLPFAGGRSRPSRLNAQNVPGNALCRSRPCAPVRASSAFHAKAPPRSACPVRRRVSLPARLRRTRRRSRSSLFFRPHHINNPMPPK